MTMKREWRKITASLLALVMIISSLPLNLIAYAEGEQSVPGIGVINTAYVQDEAVSYNTYQVKLYTVDPQTKVKTSVAVPSIADITNFTMDAGNEAGRFTLADGGQVNLLSSTSFCNYLKIHNVDLVEISFLESEDTSNPTSYKMYSSDKGERAEYKTETVGEETQTDNKTVIYTILKEVEKKDANGETVVETVYDEYGDPIGFRPVMEPHALDSSDYSLSSFVSTELIEHEVNVYWHDTGSGRPDSLEFSVTGGTATYTTPTIDSPVSENSNYDIYKYSVPYKDAQGNEITYSSTLTTNVNENDYRVVDNGSNNEFTFYGLTTFDFTIDWHQGENNPVTNTDEQIKAYLNTYFDLYDETETELDNQGNPVLDDQGNPKPKKLTIDWNDITITRLKDENDHETGSVKISIPKLDEITSDGRAKAYFVQKKTSDNIPINNDDSWKVTAENSGIHSSDISRVYQDGTISNVISGKINFSANVEWNDGANKDKREKKDDPGNVVLWRYADVYGKTEAENKERSAQCAVSPLVKTDDNGNVYYTIGNDEVIGIKDGQGNITYKNSDGTDFSGDTTGAKVKYLEQVTFDQLEKYDRFGNLYVYYAKEVLDGGVGNYNVSYSNTDSKTDGAYDGGKITNNLAGTRNFVVEAEWKAAARQGGTATVKYKVQKAIKNDQGEITGWEDVGTPLMDEDGNYLKKTGGTDENPVYMIVETAEEADTVSELILDNFKAETMKQTGRFGPLPQYDANGNEITYRVVQSYSSRTDGDNTTTIDNTEITEPDDPSVAKPIQTFNNNNDEYEITVAKQGSDKYNFTYRLTGDMPLRITKEWDDSLFASLYGIDLVPLHEGDTVEAQVKQYDFEQKKYVTFTVPTDPSAEGYIEENASHFVSAGENGKDSYFEIKNTDNPMGVGTTTQTWYITLKVPMYDSEGHEYQYDVTELNRGFGKSGTDSSTGIEYSGSYTMTMSFTAKNGNDPDTYKITNTYTEGPGYEILISKEWKDDGDLLHRKPVTITCDSSVGSSVNPTLSDTNTWQTYVGKNENYVYNSDHFTESSSRYISGTNSTSYTIIATKANDYNQTITFHNLPAGTYRLRQKNGDTSKTVQVEVDGITVDKKVYEPKWEEVATNLTSDNGNISVNLTRRTKIVLEKQDTSDANKWDAVQGITTTAGGSDPYISSNVTGSSFTVNSDHTIDINYSGVPTYTLVGGGAPTGYEWINYLTCTYDSDTANSTIKDSLKTQKIVRFPNLVAVYQDGDHYYAVEQTNSGDGSVKFTNTRIGVVTYEVDLDWCMGGWEASDAQNKTFKVRISGKINGVDTSFDQLINVSAGQHSYFLTNLPKYDSQGKIIDWEISEIELAGQTITNGTCTVNGKRCRTTVTDTTYTNGTVSHSDDLIRVKITNRFEGTTDAKVNKMWFDDNNALGLRGDTYIQLWYRSTAPGTQEWTQLGGDYVWTATQDTEWHYTFSDLPEFDSKGYPYEYAIRELSVADYSTSMYDGSYSPATDTGTASTLTDNKVPNGGWFVDRLSGNVVVDGKKLWNNISTVLAKSHYPIAKIELYRENKYRKIITVDRTEFSQDTSDPAKYTAAETITGLPAGTYKAVAVSSGITVSPANETTVPANGSITVTLTSDTEVTEAKDFKLLYKENNVWTDYQVLSTDDETFKIGETSIYSGDSKFIFKKAESDSINTHAHEIEDGYYVIKNGSVPDTKNLGTVAAPIYSMVLPKFDENGALITYTLKEVPINGYAFEISNDKIVNEFKGGRPIEIRVTKNWGNMHNVEYPAVKLILHQIMFAKTMNEQGTDFVKDSNNDYVLTPIEYATFEKVLKRGDGNNWTYVFGENVIEASNIVIDKSKFTKVENQTDTYTAAVTVTGLDAGTYKATAGADMTVTPASEVTATDSGEITYTVTVTRAELNDKEKFRIEKKVQENEWESVTNTSVMARFNSEAETVEALEVLSHRKNSKEDIRQFAPDGSVFTYYVTEELINSDGESVQLNAIGTDNSDTHNYLGDGLSADKENKIIDGLDVYSKTSNSWVRKEAVEQYPAPMPEGKTKNDYILIEDSGLGFRLTELVQPDAITNEAYTELKKQLPITRNATLKNSYEPELNNFNGKLIVNKTWNNHDDPNGNDRNTDDFGDFKDYSFEVSRQTKNIDEQKLFTIKTSSANQVPEVIYTPTLYEDGDKKVLITEVTQMTAHYAGNDSQTIEYYEQKLNFVKKYNSNTAEDLTVPVTIKVYKGDKTSADYNKVEISGLAIYAQDALRYFYKINEIMTEDEFKAYKNNDNPQSGKMLDYNANGDLVTGDEAVAETKKEFTLDNELKVFDLHLYKVFGKKYTPEGSSEPITVKLDPADYHQYFNSNFVSNLEFKLYRKEQGDVNFVPYKYKGDNNDDDNPIYKVTTANSAYDKVFRNLPMYSTSGKKYIYQIEEIEPDGTKYYSVLYTNSRDSIGSTEKVEVSPSDDNTTTVNTYVRNVFEAKQIDVNKYWDDNDNADGMRPSSVHVVINERIPIDPNNPEAVNFERILDEGILEQDKKWTKKVELPKYYYNGSTPVPGLKYGIAETTDELFAKGYNDPTYTYMISENGFLETKKLSTNESISVSKTEDGQTIELEALNVYNSKDPINSKLRFDKQWDDKNNEWELRPDHIYVKLTRDTKDIIEINPRKDTFNIPGSMAVLESEATGKYNMTVTIRNLDSTAALNYKVQQMGVNGWDDINSTCDDEPGNTDVAYIKFTVNDVDTSMIQMFKIVNTAAENSPAVNVDRDGKPLVAIVNDSVLHDVVKTDNSGYTAGAKETTALTVDSSGKISVPKEKAIDEKVGVLVTGLDKYSTTPYSYKVEKSDDAGFASPTTLTGNELRRNDTANNQVSLSVKADSGNNSNSLYIRVKRSVEGGAEELVTQISGLNPDSYTGGIQVTPDTKVTISGLPKNNNENPAKPYTYKIYVSENSNFSDEAELDSTVTANNTTVTISATPVHFVYLKLSYKDGSTDKYVTSGFTVIGGRILENGVIRVQSGEPAVIEGLSKNMPYEYKVYDGGTALSSGVEVRDTTDKEKVDVLALLDNVTDNKTLTIKRSVNGGTDEPVTGVTAYRFFAVDRTTGVVALPASQGKTDNENVDNPIELFENLSYGVVNTDGSWKPYYYTTVECDKYGNDADSKLKSTQTDKKADGDQTKETSINLNFQIDVSGYSDRKHINIKIMRGNDIVKTDINGNPLKITVDGAEYYASDRTDNTPAKGVIVIPVSTTDTYINCTVHDLPYAPESSGGYDTPFDYTVKRCKANGNDHSENNGELPLKDLSDNNSGKYYDKPTNTTPAKTTLTYEKTWTKYAVDEGLKPEEIHLKLCRTYTAADGTKVTEEVTEYNNQLNTIDVSTANNNDDPKTYVFAGSIDDLPAGKVINKDDVGIWRRYNYFFKEYYDSAYTEEKPGSTTYGQFEQTKGEDKPFVLTSNGNNMVAELAEGIKNTLTTTSHAVNKTWKDQDAESTKNRSDYYLVLERRAGIEGAWEKVDLNYTAPWYIDSQNNNKVDMTDHIETAGSGESSYTRLRVEEEKLNIRFDELPYCDEKGAVYQYRVAEVGIGSNDVINNKTYFFLVPGTEPTDEDYSYVRIIRRGTSNYYVNYNYDSEKTNCELEDYDYSKYDTVATEIENTIVTNSVSFSHISVTKTWNDEDNVYGKRPEEVKFRLTRTKDGELDGGFKSDKSANEANDWKCDWSQLAAFAADGGRFEYFVDELPVAYYHTDPPVETSETVNGETTKKLTYTNTYIPQKKTITAEKLWDDQSDIYGLRPKNVTYELYCKYKKYTSTVENGVQTLTEAGTYNGAVYTAGADDADQSEVYKEIKYAKEHKSIPETVSENDFVKTLSSAQGDSSDSNKWKIDFGELPAWINPTGDSRYNGKAVEVTYYIVETFTDAETDVKYKKVYNCEASNKYGSATENIPGTSTNNFVLEKGLLYSDSYSTTDKSGKQVYAVPTSIADENGKINVLIRDLDAGDTSGNRYSYNIVETDGNGYTNTTSHGITRSDSPASPFISSDGEITGRQMNDKLDLLVTADISADDPKPEYIYFTVTRTKEENNSGFVKELDRAANGTAFTVNGSNTISYTPSSAAQSIKFTALPGSGETDPYGYTVKEYDSNGAVVENSNMTITAAANTSDSTKVDITVTKSGAAAGTPLYFRISRSGTEVTPKELLGTSYDLHNDIFSYTWTVSDNNSVTIQDLPARDANNNLYTYEAVEYDGDAKDAVEVTNLGDDKKISRLQSNESGGKVNVTVKKPSNNPFGSNGQTVYFKLRRKATNVTTDYVTTAANRLVVKPINYTLTGSDGNPTILKAEQNVSSSITNTLNTRDIVVTKVWNDNGYADGRKLHYDIDVTLSSTQFNCTESGRSSDNHYSETKAIPKDYDENNPNKPSTDFANAVIFRGLPKYKSDGTLIDYAVTETVAAVTGSGSSATLEHQAVAGDLVIESGTEPSLTYTVPNTTPAQTSTLGVASNNDSADLTLTAADRKYGYTGKWESYKDSSASDNAVVRFKLTNELPIATFNVDVYWNDDENRDGKRPTKIQAVLTRKDYKLRDVDTETPEGKTSYKTDGRKIYFVDTFKEGESDLTWSTPVITFKDSTGNNLTGLSTDYSFKTENDKKYIEVPIDAKKFQLTGSVTISETATPVTSVVTELTPGSTYSVGDKESDLYKLKSDGEYESKYISVETVTVNSTAFGEPQINSDKNSWRYDFGRQPVCGEDNNPFTYSISELNTTTSDLDSKTYTYDYSRSITMESNTIHNSDTSEYKDYESKYEMNDDIVKTSTESVNRSATMTSVNFSIRNNYTPEMGKIKIQKTWEDDSTVKNVTRPDSITFELYCENESGTKVLVTDNSVREWFSGYTLNSNGEYSVVAGSSTGDVWDYTIEHLPVYKNPTGTEVEHGSSGKIKYYLKEVEHAGYTLTSEHDNVEFKLPDEHVQEEEEIERDYTNTLKKADLKVKKEWVDHNYTSTHYDVDSTLTLGNNEKTWSIPTIASGDTSGVTVNDLPLYTKDGNLAQYNVTEDTIKYCYDPTYSDSNFTLTENGTKEVTITNTLPVTTLTVNKAWSDSNNTYKLRPSDITLTVGRATASDAANWDDAVTSYPVTRSRADTDANSWTITYGNLLKYNENGVPYLFKVTETVPHGYKTSAATVTTTKTEGGVVNYNVSLTNELITGTLTVVKNWNDQGVQDVAHYNETVKAESTTNVTSDNQKITFANNNINSSEGNGQSVTINNVPVFDMNGQNISYVVTETSNQQYGYYLTTTGNALQTTLTQTGGTGPYTGEVTLTNKLPKTDITVTKTWSDFDDKYGLRPASVKFNLYRTSENADVSSDEGWTVVEENRTISVDSWSYTFQNLLKFDQSGNEYRYKVKEVYENGVKAYSELEPQATTVQGESQKTVNSNFPLTFANTLKTRDITVTKVWDDEKYKGTSLRYNLDMTLSCPELTCTENNRHDTNNKYQETQSILTSDSALTKTYSDLPKCNNNGVAFTYKLEENVSGQTLTGVTSGTFLQGSKQSGYNATCTETTTDGYVTGFTVTNTLPLRKYEAIKTWTDNKNQDGKRPETLKFTLYRDSNENVQEETAKKQESWTKTDGSEGTAGSFWKVDFGYHPVNKVNNTAYSYYIQEENISDYTNGNGVTSNITDGIKYSFNNTHTPYKGDLTVTKKWNDTIDSVDYSQYTRPASVELELYCKYDYTGMNDWHKVDGDTNLASLYTGDKKQTVSVNAGTSSGSVTFSNLPLYVNPTGTETANGQAYPITYTVRETNVPIGYTPQYGSTTLSNGTSTNIDVNNDLNTVDVTVKKEWDDSGYTGSDKDHYDVNVSVTSTDIANFSKSVTIAKDNTTGETVTNLPAYKANGDPAQYILTENTHHYNYTATYDATPFTVVGTGAKNVLTVTNTLPTTSVKVTKTWDDYGTNFNNKDFRSFRPDSIFLTLYRTTKASPSADDTSVATNNKANDGWQQVATYTLNNPDASQSSNTSDTWEYTFTNLLESNEDNEKYTFMVKEDAVNAYSTSYTTQITTESSNDLAVKNTLITRDVVVNKIWEDNGYGDSLHYDIAIDLKNTANNLSFTSTIPHEVVNNIPKDTVTITKVPVYDRDDNVIVYTVDENTQKYGYQLTNTTTATYMETVKNKQVVNSYTLTNTLPVTYLKVQKNWDVNTTYHKYDKGSITVDVSRSTTDGNTVTQDSTFNSNNAGKTINYSADSMSATYGPLLVKDINNNVFTYKVQEQQLTGYTPSYSYTYTDTSTDPSTQKTTTDGTIPAETAVSGSPLTLTLMNTQITGDAKLQKIDYTYYETHKGETGYKDKPVDGAVFKLYIKDSNDAPVDVPVKWNANGYYEFNATEGTNSVTSQKGIIDIRGLPLNTYYLKETSVPAAFKTNPAEFSFIVDVNASNNPGTTYTSITPTRSNGHTTIYESNGFITHSDELPKIGDEETHRTLSLTKQDATDGTGLEKATYYLLYMIPYEIGSATTQAELDTYKQNAKDAIINSGGQFTNTVGQYWRIIDRVQTDSSGNWSTPTTGLMHGIYTLMEVQAPIGYKLDNDGFDTITYETYDPSTSTTTSGVSETTEMLLIYLDETHISCDITHEDPRKNAKVDIYKQDKFENPLNGAEFELYFVPDRYEGQIYHQSNEDSDFNYIFFTNNTHFDPDGDGPEQATLPQEGAWDKVYAYFFNSNGDVDGAFPGTEQTLYWINDDGDKVYKVIPPDGATKVVFNNNNRGKKTEDIKFTLGNGYYKTSKSTDNSVEVYTVNYNGSDGADQTKAWSHAQYANNQTVTNTQYDTYGECVYIKNDTDLIGKDKDWDDLHIYFMNDDNQIVAQKAPGYSPSNDQTIESISTYKVEIPVGATKFVLNNGNKSGTHARSTVAVPIEPNAGYSITNEKEGDNYKVKLWGRNLDTQTPVTNLNEDPQPFEWTTPIKIATVITGDNGLTESVKIINPSTGLQTESNTATEYAEVSGNKVVVRKWGTYFWKEVQGPTGYTANDETLKPFDIGANEADKVVNVINADNTPIKGTVTLTKTAQEKVGDYNIGAPVPGAVFNLYKKSGDNWVITPIANTSGLAYTVSTGTNYDMTTGSPDGKITISELDWGQYYLVETSAPAGFKVDSNKKLYFSVGRNNYEGQELSFKNVSAKAKLTINKSINDRKDAWGNPTFIFKIKQTHEKLGNDNPTSISPQREKIVSLTLTNNSLSGSVADMEIEPGTYEITEVSVSRYKFHSCTVTLPTGNNTGNTDGQGKATFTVGANETAIVDYVNHLEYYDKFSQVDCTVNHFDESYKGIRVEYTEPISANKPNDKAEIDKKANDFKVYKIMSSGKEVEVTDADYKKALTLSYTPASSTKDDTRFSTDFSDDTTNGKFTVENVSRYTDGVYTLTATDANNFTCKFDISFVSKNGQTKVYQKSVVFKADTDNKSYFTDGGVTTSQYELIFTIVESSTPGTYEVYNVKHNGEVIASGDAVASAVNSCINNLTAETNPILTVNEAFASSGWVFDKWNDGTNDFASLDYNTFYQDVVDYSKKNDAIIYTAKLKTNPTP